MKLRNRAHLLTSFALALTLAVPAQLPAADETAQWIDHLGFWPTGQVNPATDVVNTALEVSSYALGDDQFVEQMVQVPAGYLVVGVQVCYVKDSSSPSYLSRIRLAQLQDPLLGPAVLVLDDITNWEEPAACVSVSVPEPAISPVDPSNGALRLGLGFNFLEIISPNSLPIEIRSVALMTIPDPNSPAAQTLTQLRTDLDALVGYVNVLATDVNGLDSDVSQLKADVAELEADVQALESHTHTYLTGRGTGHNNTRARTTGPTIVPVPTPTSAPMPIPPPTNNKNKQ